MEYDVMRSDWGALPGLRYRSTFEPRLERDGFEVEILDRSAAERYLEEAAPPLRTDFLESVKKALAL